MFKNLILAVIGCIIGWVVYTLLISNAYSNLNEAIKVAPMKNFYSSNDPAMLLYLSDQKTEINDEIVRRLLVNNNIITEFTNPNDYGNIKETIVELKQTETENSSILKILLKHFFNEQEAELECDEGRFELISRMLANTPSKTRIWIGNNENCKSINLNSLNFSQFMFPRSIFPSNWGDKPTSKEITELIYQDSEQYSKYQNIGEHEKFNTEYKLSQALLVSIMGDKTVTKALNKLNILEGPTQFLMFAVFFVGILFLNRLRKRNAILLRVTDESKAGKLITTLKKSNLILKWIVSTLPVLGFMGTIIGLMNALGDADLIPLATNNLSASIAISTITEQLSIAFTTTLLAFTLGLILAFLKLMIDLKYKSNVKIIGAFKTYNSKIN